MFIHAVFKVMHHVKLHKSLLFTYFSVVGVGEIGKRQLRHLGKLLLPRRYFVKGQFGQASLSHSKFSKVVDRSTYDHITEDKVNRLLTQIQGAHRNACIR